MKLRILKVTFSGRPVVLYYLAPAEIDVSNTGRVVVRNKDSFAIPTVQQVYDYETAPEAIKKEATEFIVGVVDTRQHQRWVEEYEAFQKWNAE